MVSQGGVRIRKERQARKGRRGEEGQVRNDEEWVGLPLTNNFFLLMPKYVYRNGAHIKGVDASTACEELSRIHDKHDGLTNQDVLDESRPEEAPLHPIFEWDDSLAAEEWRKKQAGDVVRAVRIVQPEGHTEPVFIHVKVCDAYLKTEVVAKSPDLMNDALNASYKRLREAEQSLATLKMIAKGEERLSAEKALEHVKKGIESLPSSS